MHEKRCPSCGRVVEATALACPHDGTSLVNPIDQEPEFKNKYEFLGPIGAGGMGVIYKARQTVLDKFVAIKMLHPHIVSKDSFRRFQIEGKAISLLQHQYIINIHDLSTTESGRPFMVMDFVEGRTLAKVIEDDGPLKTDRFLHIFGQICDALAHAHNRGVLHRDLKPSNIMLTQSEREEEVRIMDFGIAKLIDATEQDGAQQLTKTGDTIGSPQYMSPEQACGGKSDKRSDLYSLGCVMYEALTGAPPFSGSTPLETMMMHLNDKPVSMSQSLLGKMEFNPDLEMMVARLLEKKPDLRYQSMEELKSALSRLQAGKNLDRFTDTGRADKTDWQSICIAALLGAAVMAALCVVGFYFWKKSDPAPQLSLAPWLNLAPESQKESRKEEATEKENANIGKSENQLLIKSAVARQDRVLKLYELCDFNEVTNDDIAPLENATNTTDLSLRDAKIDDLGLEHIARLNLTKLNLRNTGVENLHALKNMSTLKELDLEQTSLNDEGMSVLGHLTNLTTLSLNKTGNTNDDDRGLEPISQLKLEKLNVRETGVKDLHALKNMTTLKELDLEQTPLGDKGMSVLGHLTNLTSLNLDKTGITDADLHYLTGLKNLKVLRVRHCFHLTPKALDSLQTKLPGCSIVVR